MALTWWLIGIVIVIALIVIFKSQDLVYIFSLVKKNFFFILFILVILFLTFSFISIYRTHDIDLTSYDGIIKGGKLYFTWILSLFSNLGNVLGYAVSQNWIPGNSTNATG